MIHFLVAGIKTRCKNSLSRRRGDSQMAISKNNTRLQITVRRLVLPTVSQIRERGLGAELSKRIEREIGVFALENKIKCADAVFERALKGKAIAK